ncbi:MAG: hypothetical protein EHM70_00690, partial [Chloroflexota bacterium]
MIEKFSGHLEEQKEPLKAALIELVRIPSVLAEDTQEYPFGAAIDQALCKAYATRIFGDCADVPSGRLKFNIGKIQLDAEERVSIDIRLPVSITNEGIVSTLSTAAARYGLEYKEFDWLAPIYLPKVHSVIETLVK